MLAIAITLLVLLPFDEVAPGELADALGEHWATFGAYAASFTGVGLVWRHHHSIFGAVTRVDRPKASVPQASLRRLRTPPARRSARRRRRRLQSASQAGPPHNSVLRAHIWRLRRVRQQ